MVTAAVTKERIMCMKFLAQNKISRHWKAMLSTVFAKIEILRSKTKTRKTMLTLTGEAPDPMKISPSCLLHANVAFPAWRSCCSFNGRTYRSISMAKCKYEWHEVEGNRPFQVHSPLAPKTTLGHNETPATSEICSCTVPPPHLAPAPPTFPPWSALLPQ